MKLDWELVESWLRDDSSMRQEARLRREEASRFRDAYYEAVSAHADGRGYLSMEEIQGLRISFWNATTKAAEIERKLRNI